MFLKMERIPSGDGVERMGAGQGLAGLARLQRELLDCVLADHDGKADTPDIDATPIMAEKEAAH